MQQKDDFTNYWFFIELSNQLLIWLLIEWSNHRDGIDGNPIMCHFYKYYALKLKDKWLSMIHKNVP